MFSLEDMIIALDVSITSLRNRITPIIPFNFGNIKLLLYKFKYALMIGVFDLLK